jgi:sugar-specific transcriptional regulator TrmB
MSSNILEQLQEAGLPKNEAKVYLELVRGGQVTGSEIAKRNGLDRSLTYTILQNLKNKGLCVVSSRGKTQHFIATEPENLLASAERTMDAAQKAVKNLPAVKRKSGAPSFEMYEGTAGIKAYMRRALSQRECLSIGGSGKLYDFAAEHSPHFLREAQNSGIKGRVITSAGSGRHPMAKLLGLEVRVLPVVSPTTICVFEDFVAIHLLEENLVAFVISDEKIVQGYRAYLEFLWKQASPVGKNRSVAKSR